MDSSNITNIDANKQAFNFLTEVYEVMKCFENNPSKLGSKINELKIKYEKARTILSNIPGIDMSHSDQQEYYQTLLRQYKRENDLFNSYKDLCKFDIGQLDQTPDLTNGSSSSGQANNMVMTSTNQFNFNDNQNMYITDENIE